MDAHDHRNAIGAWRGGGTACRTACPPWVAAVETPVQHRCLGQVITWSRRVSDAQGLGGTFGDGLQVGTDLEPDAAAVLLAENIIGTIGVLLDIADRDRWILGLDGGGHPGQLIPGDRRISRIPQVVLRPLGVAGVGVERGDTGRAGSAAHRDCPCFRCGPVRRRRGGTGWAGHEFNAFAVDADNLARSTAPVASPIVVTSRSPSRASGHFGGRGLRTRLTWGLGASGRCHEPRVRGGGPRSLRCLAWAVGCPSEGERR